VLITLAVEGYRSLRDVVLPLGPLTAVTGPNGSGKSNLYRALRLVAEASRNGAVAALAREGGLPSTLWAGPETVSRRMLSGEDPVQGTRRSGPVSLRLGFASDDFGYALDLGLPVPGPAPEGRLASAFDLDPEIKRECTWSGPVARPAAMLTDRRGGVVRVRDDQGEWQVSGHSLQPYDSMLSELSDPANAPEVLALRERIRAWRFYDHFRTDPQAPARRPSIGTRTPVLGHDGADLAAAWQTILEVGDRETLSEVLDLAFPGSTVEIRTHDDGVFSLALRQPGMLRPLSSAELSDGTLRFLLLLTALLTPRPPELMVVNEPESSLHPDLLPALGRLVVATSARTQVVVVTHSAPLVAALTAAGEQGGRELTVTVLRKDLGQTSVEGQTRFGRPAWVWPPR
jgi:predicted ATPase